MSCERMEEQLQRYLEGDLSQGERAEVEVHLRSCARCRRSLADFEALEASLGTLRAAIPEWKTAEATFLRRAGLERRPTVLAFVLSGPMLAAAALVSFGIAFFFKGSGLSAAARILFVRSEASLASFEQMSGGWLRAFAGVDPTLLMAIYGLLTIGLLGASGLLVLKFCRK
jgi:anti-sigma factor RsiW